MFMLLTLIIPFTSICASSEYTEEQLKQAGGLENLLANEKKNEEKLSRPFKPNYDGVTILNDLSTIPYSNEVQLVSNFIATYFTNYPIERQQNIYYCGPASVKTSVHIINNSSLSQSTYAASMGTNYDDGTFVYKIADELDKRQSKNDYGWREIGHDNDGQPYAEDKSRLKDIINVDIKQNHVPLISRLYTKYLKQYNGKEFTHYISVVGLVRALYQSNGIDSVKYADNFYGDYGNGDVFGEHSENFDNFSTATTYIIW